MGRTRRRVKRRNPIKDIEPVPRVPRCLLLCSLLCAALLAAVACAQESISDKIDRARQQTAAAARQPPDPQITSDNAPDLLPVILEQELVAGPVYASASVHPEIGFRTLLSISSRDNSDFGFRLYFICDQDRPEVSVVWVAIAAYRWEETTERWLPLEFSAEDADTARARFGLAPTAAWRKWSFEVRPDYMGIIDGTNFLREAKKHSRVQIAIPLVGGVETTTFNLRVALNTPIQPNLDWCGLY